MQPLPLLSGELPLGNELGHPALQLGLRHLKAFACRLLRCPDRARRVLKIGLRWRRQAHRNEEGQEQSSRVRATEWRGGERAHGLGTGAQSGDPEQRIALGEEWVTHQSQAIDARSRLPSAFLGNRRIDRFLTRGSLRGRFGRMSFRDLKVVGLLCHSSLRRPAGAGPRGAARISTFHAGCRAPKLSPGGRAAPTGPHSISIPTDLALVLPRIIR